MAHLLGDENHNPLPKGEPCFCVVMFRPRFWQKEREFYAYWDGKRLSQSFLTYREARHAYKLGEFVDQKRMSRKPLLYWRSITPAEDSPAIIAALQKYKALMPDTIPGSP